MREKTTEKVIVRMAPSPTGYFHIGSVRTALFNFLFARKHGGTFIYRSEDTNDERSKKEYEDNIIESLHWLGLNYDIFFRQSDRTNIYVSYLKEMLENGSVYFSKEEPKKEGERSEVIRFKNPNKKIAFDDLVRGKIEFDTTDLGDFVIAKSLEEPLYHLAVVVDDHEMKVTHVIRGEDILSSTPRQILIQEVIGATRPIYAHIPLILAPDRSKLSKRHGATSLMEYRKKGYLPQAILNYMALLGWNPGTEQEIFTLPQLVEAFDLLQVQKSGAIFDEKKLEWVNKEHLKLLPEEERKKILLESIRNESYILGEPELDPEKITWKKVSKEETLRLLEGAKQIIEDDGDPFDKLKASLMAYAEKEGRGNVLWPVRYALTGLDASPDPFTILEILGKEESLQRLEKAIIALQNAGI